MPKKTPKRAPNQLSPEREKDIVEAAVDVFIEKGLGNSTMAHIAERAGITKVTLYRRFENKYVLFDQMIALAAESMAEQMSDLVLDIEQPVASLRSVGLKIGVLNSRPRHTEIMRLIIAETGRHEEACIEARTLINSKLVPLVEAFFRQLIDLGNMQCDYPDKAARAFVLLFARGMRPLFRVQETQEAIDQQFAMDMQMFVKGFAIKD